MIDHVTLQVADLESSRIFYEAMLAPLGGHVVTDEESTVGFYGASPGSFWLIPAQRQADRELHLAFLAAERAQVRVFHETAIRIDAEVLHPPRLFREYHEHYYAAFIRDPDGHNVEAVCHRPE